MALAARLVSRSSGVRWGLKKGYIISSLSRMASQFWSMPSGQLFADAQDALRLEGGGLVALVRSWRGFARRYESPFSLPTHVTRQAIRFTKKCLNLKIDLLGSHWAGCPPVGERQAAQPAPLR
jgi:hypothetical protein